MRKLTLVLLVAGCSKSTAPDAPPPKPSTIATTVAPPKASLVSATPMSPPPPPLVDAGASVAVSLLGDAGPAVPFSFGAAWLEALGLRLTLAAAPVSCDDTNTFRAEITYYIPPGVANDYFAGSGPRSFGAASVNLVSPAALAGTPGAPPPVSAYTPPARLTLEKFDAATAVRLRGRMDFDAFAPSMRPDDVRLAATSGSFDVPFCGTPPRKLPTPVPVSVATSAPTPAGSIVGTDFAAQAVYAIVPGNRDDRRVMMLELRDVPDRPCASRRDHGRAVYVQLSGYGGTPAFLHLPQPVSVMSLFEPTPQMTNGWVTFDHVELNPGDHVRGSVYVATQIAGKGTSPGAIAGRFDAVVCRATP
jgi:hypothetical protein